MLTFASITLQAQELKWHTDVSDAAKISLETKKPMMMFFTGSDWCGWCIRLQKEVFHTEEFKKWANKNVVLVELDFPRKKELPEDLKQQNLQLQQMFGVTGFPTIWFVNPQQKEGKKVNLDALGNMGYQAGGPAKWTETANTFLKKK